MEVKGEKVSHKTWGIGTIVTQTENRVYITFDIGEKEFQYPTAFKQFLVFCNSEFQKIITEEIEKAEQIKLEQEKEKAQQEKLAQLARQSYTEQTSTPTRKKKKTRTSRPNIAFKCNYCDGGKSSESIGFNGICSDKIIRHNILVEKRTWCSAEDCACCDYLYGYITGEELEAKMNDGGFVCYESQMLRDWKALAGIVQIGERMGQPMRLRNVQPNSLCILTTREPNSTEAERIIFAVFLVDNTYDGDNQEEGFVSTQSKYKLTLSQKEAEQMRFWRYHANDNHPEKEAWSSGLHRYLTDSQAVQVLRDIAKLKKNTKDAELASEFLETFCKINAINIEDVGEPSGVLANK